MPAYRPRRYIERPLLVRGRKFHVRAYVLCVGSLAVHVYSEALALFAGKPYDRCGRSPARDGSLAGCMSCCACTQLARAGA
jgi:hypothetical protein